MNVATLVAVVNDSDVEPYPGWQPDHTEAFARFLLQQLAIPDGSELSIAFIDPEPMAELHMTWLGLDGETDVMSFPMDELREGTKTPGHLGDVAICPQVAAAQAAAAGHPTRAEIELLLAHGVLHLLGHDHADPEEHALMFARQEALLKAWAEHAVSPRTVSASASTPDDNTGVPSGTRPTARSQSPEPESEASQ